MDCSILVTPKPGFQYIERSAAEKYFKEPYRAGELVRVTFEKKNGEVREMLCKRNYNMELQIKGMFDTHTPGCLTVCEEGTHWRKVNLDKIMEISL